MDRTNRVLQSIDHPPKYQSADAELFEYPLDAFAMQQASRQQTARINSSLGRAGDKPPCLATAVRQEG